MSHGNNTDILTATATEILYNGVLYSVYDKVMTPLPFVLHLKLLQMFVL